MCSRRRAGRRRSRLADLVPHGSRGRCPKAGTEAAACCWSASQRVGERTPGEPNMATAPATALENDGNLSRRRVQDADRHVGRRLRERRIMLGMTLQQLAELIGVTHHQARKYEKGLHRLAAGQLWRTAQALGVEVDYFFAGLGSQPALKPTRRQRLLLELTRNFTAIPDERHGAARRDLARVLSAEPANPHDELAAE